MAKCAGIEPCTFVMDLEGTDGRERGEVLLCFHILTFFIKNLTTLGNFIVSLGSKHLIHCWIVHFSSPVNECIGTTQAIYRIKN